MSLSKITSRSSPSAAIRVAGPRPRHARVLQPEATPGQAVTFVSGAHLLPDLVRRIDSARPGPGPRGPGPAATLPRPSGLRRSGTGRRGPRRSGSARWPVVVARGVQCWAWPTATPSAAPISCAVVIGPAAIPARSSAMPPIAASAAGAGTAARAQRDGHGPRGGFRSAVRAVITNVPGTGRVQDIRAPEVSSSWRDVLIQFAMKGDPDTAANRVQPVLDAVSRRGPPIRG